MFILLDFFVTYFVQQVFFLSRWSGSYLLGTRKYETEEDWEHAILNHWSNQLYEISFFLMIDTSFSHFMVLIELGFE